MSQIELSCKVCKKTFWKELKEHRRRIKEGATEFYCSRSCVCIQRNLDNPQNGDIERIPKDKRTRKKDEFTPFRWYVLRSEYRNRRKHYGCNITPQYLKQIWDSQNGICPLTGWKLVLPRGTDVAWTNSNPYNASLDRIDNSKGYVKGNVRFICFMANIGRGTFSDEQLVEFCKAVVDKNK